jgi:hypothetical protein
LGQAVGAIFGIGYSATTLGHAGDKRAYHKRLRKDAKASKRYDACHKAQPVNMMGMLTT